MARRTFFSFHYQEDVWRVFNVRKCWAIGKDREANGLFDGSVFEASKKEGDEALKAFLRDGLKNTSVTCVLAGQHTAARRCVRYPMWPFLKGRAGKLLPQPPRATGAVEPRAHARQGTLGPLRKSASGSSP